MESSFISDCYSLEEDLRWGLFPLLFALSSSSLFPSRLGKVFLKASFVSVDESHSVCVPLRCASVIFHAALFESVCLYYVYKPCACGFYFIILLLIQKPAVTTVPAVSSVPPNTAASTIDRPWAGKPHKVVRQQYGRYS